MTNKRMKYVLAALVILVGAAIVQPGSRVAAAVQDDGTAASKYNWGTPLPGSDEFDYSGAPDAGKWGVYGAGGDEGGSGSKCWPGHSGNGRRCASANTVADGYLRQTGLANGDTAGIASKTNLKYGRWEVRARMAAAPGASGDPYHPVLITWPANDQWPAGAEYDFLEVNIGDPGAGAFLHYPNHQPKVQEYAEKAGVDLTQWHNYGFEWTAGGLVGYIDGAEWFRFDSDCIQCAPGPMHLTIQLDNFFGAGGLRKAFFDVDWARIYSAP
ncbi:MAG TPA: glycoside hydrolase family 16 protein [Kribbella sp.]